MDISILNSALACRQDTLTTTEKLTAMLQEVVLPFNPDAKMSTDNKDRRQSFVDTMTCVIQPRRQGQQPVEIDLFRSD